MARIRVFLADDNLLVRSGVAALLRAEPDLEVVGEAADYDSLVTGVVESEPQVVVTDIRMPPTFQREGLEAAKEARRRFPGIGVVILSQFDDPEYAIALLADGAAGYGYLLKDRVAEGTQLADAVRAVATGRTALDPVIVDSLTRPVSAESLPAADEELLTLLASGRTIKAIAAARRVTPEAAANDVERLFLTLARGASAGQETALRRLRQLHQVIIDQVETGETLSRLLPGGLAEKLRADGRAIGESERVVLTVLMSDIRGYSTISEHADPAALASQLSEHRGTMNEAVSAEGGTVMLYVGDAVMATFGAPFPQADHAERGLATAARMHALQQAVNARWEDRGLPPFNLGIGLSTGEAAAALLGSEDRLEYTVVGDTVNLAQRLQQFAAPGETVLSEITWRSLPEPPAGGTCLGAQQVKGRSSPVVAYKLAHS
jgi:adenylate cyclase